MSADPKCPKCKSDNCYFDGQLFVCPDCSHEWTESSPVLTESEVTSDEFMVKDASQNILQDGDSVSIIKDLKLKGSSSVLKVGTKVKNIKLVESNDGHNISCKIDGFGSMFLKSEFVRKI